MRGQLALRQAFVFTESYYLMKPEVYVAKAMDKFDANGNLTDEETREHVRRQIEVLMDWMLKLKAAGLAM